MPSDFRQIALRLGRILLTALLPCTLATAPFLHAAHAAADEQLPGDDQTAQRYLAALLRNPRPGTAFDRVYAWHADRGTPTELRNTLLQHASSSGQLLPNSITQAQQPAEPASPAISLPASCPADAAICVAALIDLRHGEPETAAALLKQAATLRPQDPVTHWLLAKALDQSEQFSAAADAFEAALARRPARADLAEIHRDYARSLMRQRQPEAALAVWQRLEQTFPGDRRVLRQVARALSEDGRWTDALARYQQLATAADSPEERIAAELEVCESLRQLDRRDDALKRLLDLLPELDPDGWLYRDVRSRIEQLYRSANDLTGLAALYETQLRQQPDDLDVIQRLARILLELDRGEEARQWLSKALQRAPDNPQIRDAWIAALAAGGQQAAAASQLEQWLQSDVAVPSQFRQLGLLQLARADLPPSERQKLAATAFEKLAQSAGNEPRLLRQAAELMERAAQLPRAEELFRQAFNADPRDDLSREALGLFLHRRQRRTEAIAIWQTVAEGSLRNPETLGQFAETLRRAGYISEALAARREACTLNPQLDDRLRFVELLLEAAAAAPESAANAPIFDEAQSQLDLADANATEAAERSRVLELRVRMLLSSDRLETVLRNERKRLNGPDAKNATADDYRRLCACEAAAGQASAAAAACVKVVQLQPNSAADWNLLAQLYERAGMLGDAADTLGKLMELDRRGWTDYQQQLVRLELQQGRPEEAFAAAAELTKAAPGSVEAWQFLAETAFSAGRAAEGVAALRRAVRASPGDVSALRSLARTLADEFQTAEAIELTWRAFEQTIESQERLDLTAQLAHLALRSGRWNALEERMEQWVRTQSDPIDAARAHAALLHEAGRFSAARAVLEPLLHADPDNSLLLTELAELAERERNGALAADYLLRLYRSSGSLADLRRLLMQDAAAKRGSGVDGGRLIREAAAAAISRSSFHAIVQLAVSREYPADALAVCLERIDRDPDDWWTLYQAGILTTAAGDSAAAAEIWRKLLAMPLALSSTPEVSLSLTDSAAAAHSAAAAASGSDTGPANFAEAMTAGLRQLAKLEGARGLQQILADGFIERQGLGPLQSAFTAAVDGNDNALTQECSELLLQAISDRPGAAATEFRLSILQQLLRLARTSAGLEQQSQLEERLAAAALEFLHQETSLPPNPAAFNPDQLRGTARRLWQSGLLNAATTGGTAAADRAGMILQQAALLRDESLFATVLSNLPWNQLNDSQRQSLQRLCSHPAAAAWIGELRQASAVQLWLGFLSNSSLWGDDRLSIRLLTVAQPGAIQFRHQAGAANVRERLLSAAISRGLQLSAGTAGELWQHWFGPSAGLTEFEGALLRAELQRQRGAAEPLLRELAAAARLNPAEWNLRIWLAEQLPALGLTDEALALLQQLPRTDARAAIDAELLALNISVAADRTERAREAALRLSGLPLSDAQQQRLIPVLGRLGLNEVLRSVEVRLGRSTETRAGVLSRKLQTALAAGDTQRGGELAWELLRLSSGGSLFSGYRPADDRDDGGERLQALKALAQCGRLEELTERYEAMLKAAPDSLPLLELLAELDDAAGNSERLALRQDRIAALSGRVSPGRRKRALELENRGDVSAACDLYLEILREDPPGFGAEAETFYQAFERAKRIRDFLQGVLQLDAAFWREHARLLVTAAAAAGTAHDPVANDPVMLAAARLLADSNTRRLALGTLMNTPGLLAESQIAASFQQELEQLAGRGQQSVTELLASCSELVQLVAMLDRPELLQRLAESTTAPGQPQAVRVVRIAAAAKLGLSDSVTRGTEQLLLEAGQGSGDDEELAVAVELTLLLQQRLAANGSQWTALREQVLRKMLDFSTARGTADDQLRSALAELLQQTGRANEARQLLIDRIIKGSANADVRSAAGIRELLKVAEQVQHSGYPVESAELLAGISAHELEQFTKTLEPDRASAFRSRWNAAVRWSVQQMQAERLVLWLESQLDELPAETHAAAQTAEGRNLLLLVLNGPADPGETDPARLAEVTVDSLLLEALWRSDLKNAELRDRIRAAVTKLQKRPAVEFGLLCAAAAFADRFDLADERDRLLDRLLQPPVVASQDDRSQPETISTALAALPEAGLMLLAEKLLREDRIVADRADQLWRSAAAASDRNPQRLVQLAVANHGASAARRLQRSEVAAEYQLRADQLIASQLEAELNAAAAAGTLAEQIRLLLGK
jgi:tetratricopeptide (TPR) repeat protein